VKRPLPGILGTTLVVVGGIAGLIGLMVFVLAITAPQTVEMLGIGTTGLQSELLARAENVEPLFGIRPLLDGVLLVGAYVTVCLLLWLQRQVGSLLANRTHFK